MTHQKASKTNIRSPKETVLVLLALVSFSSGATAAYFDPYNPWPPYLVIFNLIMASLLFVWYHLDSTERSYKRSRILNVGIVLLPIIAMPYYLIRSRGIKKGSIATCVFILAIIISLILTEAGYWLVFSLESQWQN